MSLIIGEQEKLILDRKATLVYPGSTLGIDSKEKSIREYETIVNDVKEKALSAPIPNIGMADSSLLLRAVPMVHKVSKNGIIMMDQSNMNDNTITKMDKLTHLVEFVQEVLVIGDTVAENYPSIKAGMMVRFDEERFVKGRYDAAKVENELYYDIPVVTIDGFDYLMISASDVLYYLK